MKAFPPHFHNRLMMLCLVAGGLLLTLTSERIFQSGGLGYDGVSYGLFIMHYEDIASGAVSVSNHLYLRSLPALAARAVMLLAGIPLDTAHVVQVFQVWNLGMLGLAAWAWGRACDAAGMGSQGKWLGFCGLFVNYAVLKYTFYYPVLLDASALALGTTLLWLYLARRRWWVLGIGALGIIFSPPVGLEAILLCVFPRPAQAPNPVRPARLWPAALAVVAGGAALYRLYRLGPLEVFAGMFAYEPLAKCLTALCVFGGIFFLFDDARFYRLADWHRNKPLVRSLAAAVLAGGLLLAAPILFPGLPQPDWVALFLTYVTNVLVNSAARPGEFLVAHTLYYGPVILLAVCRFPAMCAAARRFGNGFVLVLAFALLQFLNPLSRQMIGALPFLILPLCLALEKTSLPRFFPWVFGAVSLGASKVWLVVNAGADPALAMHDQPAVWRRYLSSTGMWMSTPDYLAQGTMVLTGLSALAGFLLWMRRRTRVLPE